MFMAKRREDICIYYIEDIHIYYIHTGEWYKDICTLLLLYIKALLHNITYMLRNTHIV